LPTETLLGNETVTRVLKAAWREKSLATFKFKHEKRTQERTVNVKGESEKRSLQWLMASVAHAHAIQVEPWIKEIGELCDLRLACACQTSCIDLVTLVCYPLKGQGSLPATPVMPLTKPTISAVNMMVVSTRGNLEEEHVSEKSNAAQMVSG
jgi:hypothetical protein